MNPLDALVNRLAYPTFVVTAANELGPTGCVVGFTTQCSVNPPRLLVCLPVAAKTYRVASEAQALAVHLIDSGDSELGSLFGNDFAASDDGRDRIDQFARCNWRPGRTGAPVLRDCVAWAEGDVLERLRLGDHVGFVIVPVDGGIGSSAEIVAYPLTQVGDSEMGVGELDLTQSVGVDGVTAETRRAAGVRAEQPA
ncbi:MAG TPA: flavin reductase family protein [Acidimicrobiales bacterium]|nr:flavin reductase family protein [Acidimicrobiales bacterium]